MSGATWRELTIVIPMYNEAGVLRSSLLELGRHVDLDAVELILVDDGSSDDTAAVARRLVSGLPSAQVISLDPNRGKGAAVRAGVLASTGESVLFMDADLSTSLDAVPRFLDELHRHDVVIGSRSVAGAVVSRSSAVRVAMGRSFNALMRATTGLGLRDSQCGFKAFRGDVARTLFALGECDRFAFDPEILRMAHVLGWSIAELPVNWTAGRQSAVRPVRDSWTTFVDLLDVRWATRRSRVLRRAATIGVPVDPTSPLPVPLPPPETLPS